MANKILCCDDLTYLEDLPVFDSKVNFKIHDEHYTVKESYKEFKDAKQGDKDEGLVKIIEKTSFDNKITEFNIKIDPSDNSIVSYKCDGPATFAYTKPITRSARTIFNRESKSIGYKASTGELMNCTRLVRHIFFDKVTDKISALTKEFFRGDEKDGENPPLNSITHSEIIKDKKNSNDDFEKRFNDIGLYNAETVYTMFDKDGNIEDYYKTLDIIGETIQGELIVLDTDFIYTANDDYKEIIIPQMDVDPGAELFDEYSSSMLLVIRYIKKSKPFVTLCTEKFMLKDGSLIPIFIESNGTEYLLDFNDIENKYSYTAKSVIDDEEFIIEGETLFPLSADMFSITKYKGIISTAMNSYFNNIFETDNGTESFYNKNKLKSAKIKLTNNEVTFDYEYDQFDIIKSMKMTNKNKTEELCIYQVSKLPNGNEIIESAIYAEPSFPINKKSIFYTATEVSNGYHIESQYSCLIINQKDYS